MPPLPPTATPDGGTIDFRDGRWIVPDQPTIPFIEGDGTGPDIWRAAQRVFDAAVKTAGNGRGVAWREVLAGEKAFKQTGSWLPEETLEAIRQYRVAIKGPLTTPVGGGVRSVNVSLRQLLDLYACIRPVRYFPGVPSPVREPHKLDVVIFRENVEDVYAGNEYEAGTDQANRVRDFLVREMGAKIREHSAIGVKPMSKFGSQRLVVKAIQYALDSGRPSVTLVHKGNIMKFTEGAFRDWGYQVARERFGDRTIHEGQEAGGTAGKIIVKDRIADAMFQQVLLRPDEYSVIATPNLDGDYLSAACPSTVGRLGLTPAGDLETPLLAVIVPTGTTVPTSLAALDRATGGIVARAITSGDFKGKRDEAQLLYPVSGKIQRLLLVGVGKGTDVSRSALRRAAAVAAKRARQLGAKTFALLAAAEARTGVKPKDWGQVAVEGAAHGAWIFTDMKQATEEPRVDVEAVEVIADAKEAKETEAGRRIGEATAAGARYTRRLQMLPGNVCTPTYLADQAAALANRHGFGVTVLDLAAIKKEGMGALLAVAQGSVEEPRLRAM